MKSNSENAGFIEDLECNPGTPDCIMLQKASSDPSALHDRTFGLCLDRSFLFDNRHR